MTGFSPTTSKVVAEEASVPRGMREVGGDPQECGVKREEFRGVGRVCSARCGEGSRKIRTGRRGFGDLRLLFMKTAPILTELRVEQR